MGRNVIETVMGAIVLIVAAGFLMFAYQSGNVKPIDGYSINAKFDTVSGLALGSDVRIGGIKVGVVKNMDIDPKSYRANIVMQIKEDIKVPTDSTAAVVSDGLLGGKYVKLEPGGDEAMLEEGQTIEFTQSSVNLEELIGKMVFSGGGVGDKKSSGNTPETAQKPQEGELTTTP